MEFLIRSVIVELKVYGLIGESRAVKLAFLLHLSFVLHNFTLNCLYSIWFDYFIRPFIQYFRIGKPYQRLAVPRTIHIY